MAAPLVFLRFFADLVNSFGSKSNDPGTMIYQIIKEWQMTKMRIKHLEEALNQDIYYFGTKVRILSGMQDECLVHAL